MPRLTPRQVLKSLSTAARSTTWTRPLADYKAKGIDAKGYICDVTKEDEVKKMVEDIERELGVIDILVNNAGIIKRIPMTEMSVEDFRQVVDIDLNAPFIVSKAVIPGMIKKGHGKIINVCSMMSELGRETVSAYAAAKGRTEDAHAQHLLRVRRTQHTVQRHRPGLHRHAADGTPARTPGRRQPPPVRQLYRVEDPRRALGHARRPDGPGGVSSPPTLQTSSMATSSTLTAAYSPTSASSPDAMGETPPWPLMAAGGVSC